MGFIDDMKKRWEYEKTTPIILITNWKMNLVQPTRLGALSYYKHNGIARFSYGSVGYEFSFLKPFAKFADEETTRELDDIDGQIKALKEKRDLVCKNGFKKSKRTLFEDDVLKMIDERKEKV